MRFHVTEQRYECLCHLNAFPLQVGLGAELLNDKESQAYDLIPVNNFCHCLLLKIAIVYLFICLFV